MLSAQWVSSHECYIPNASKDPKAASKSYNYYVLKVETQGFRVKASRFDVISPLIKSHLTNTKQLKILRNLSTLNFTWTIIITNKKWNCNIDSAIRLQCWEMSSESSPIEENVCQFLHVGSLWSGHILNFRMKDKVRKCGGDIPETESK